MNRNGRPPNPALRDRTEKRCSGCRQLQPIACFALNRKTADRHNYECRSCTKARSERFRAKYRDRIFTKLHNTCLCGNAKVTTARRCKACENQIRADEKAERDQRVCRTCGKTFQKTKTGGNKGLYCSRECAWKNPDWIKAKTGELERSWGRQKHRLWPKIKRPSTPRYCTECARPLTFPQRVICGPSCKRRRFYRQRYERKIPKPRITRWCVSCNERLPPRRRVYCSPECSHRMRKYVHYWQRLSLEQQREILGAVTEIKMCRRVLDYIAKRKFSRCHGDATVLAEILHVS